MRRAVVSLVVFALLAVCPAATDGRPSQGLGPRRTEKALSRFREDLRAIHQHLVDQKPKKAYRATDDLVEEMAHRFISGPLVGNYLALAIPWAKLGTKSVTVVVEVVISETGEVRQPLVLESQGGSPWCA